MMLRKNYSRRTDALKTLKAYIQILANAKQATEISYHTFQHIFRSYSILCEYKPHTQVSKFLKEFELIILTNTAGREKPLGTMILDLGKIDYQKIRKEKNKEIAELSVIPDLGYAFINGNNIESFNHMLKSIDTVIEYYNMLYDASKNE